MKNSGFLMVLAVLLFSSCTERFVKGDKGMQYKIVKDGKGEKIAMGDFVVYESRKYLSGSGKDTVFSDSRDAMAEVKQMDTLQLDKKMYNMFLQLRNGDSLVVKTIVDSLIPPGQPYPPFVKKGQYFFETFKITHIVKDKKDLNAILKARSQQAILTVNKKTKEAFEKDYAANAEQLKADDKVITDYLAKNNITNAVKTKLGTYIIMKEPGTGNVINDSSVAKVNYTGKTLDGKIFDSNVEASFKRPGGGPYPVYMVQFGGNVVMGWYDALQQLRKGSKATLIIPSVLAYGKNGSGPNIKPNEVLMFDIEIADVTTFAEETAKYEAEQKIMEERQAAMQDSAKKAQATGPGK